jgi:hypothetical protein
MQHNPRKQNQEELGEAKMIYFPFPSAFLFVQQVENLGEF